MKRVLGALLGSVTLLGSAPSIAQTTLTIATVNNGDMIRMEALTNEFTAKNPDVNVKWVTLEENVLRQRVTTDIATKERSVRRADYRHLRSPDLGQAELARSARQSRIRL
jgi:ABC-type glycerol-3-phosphate transport system substrate-binding protein